MDQEQEGIFSPDYQQATRHSYHLIPIEKWSCFWRYPSSIFDVVSFF